MSLLNGFTGGMSVASGDQILTWKADFTDLAADQAYQTTFLAGGSLKRWANHSNFVADKLKERLGHPLDELD